MIPHLNVPPRPIRFRVWDVAYGKMRYATTQDHEDRAHAIVVSIYRNTSTDGFIVMQDTGLRTGGPHGFSLFEGDIISFSIEGVTHGPEREDIAAVHVWWCVEDGCWAFGHYTTSIRASRYMPAHTYSWWYTMQDRIDRASIKVLGNVFEHPELLPLLGYDPFPTT